MFCCQCQQKLDILLLPVTSGGATQRKGQRGGSDSLGEEAYLLAAVPESTPGQVREVGLCGV